jgi:hypothetical protein
MSASLDWSTQQGYEIRVRRRTGGPVQTKLILGRPRLGPDAAIEFTALWADEAEGDPVDTWQVLSVTDTALQVTYLPTRLGTTTAFFWGQHVVPDRLDNPRFYDCQLQHREQPMQLRGYSFVIDPNKVSVRDIPKELRSHAHLQGAWKLLPDSIREIGLEQHHYLTWQRQQQPNYYLWQERLAALDLARAVALTKKQQGQLMQLMLAGYVLHYTGTAWEVGQLGAAATGQPRPFRALVADCARPAEAVEQAAAQLWPSKSRLR